MKKGLLRFYVLFLLVATALFSCENHTITQETFQGSGNGEVMERKPDFRHPVEPNEAPKGKKQLKRVSRSSALC